jgi:hypothetical protein
MRTFILSLLAFPCLILLMVAMPRTGSAQPSLLPLAYDQNVGEMQEVGYRYRRYRYGYRPYYRPYGYYRPYYGSYGYPYYYRPYYRPYWRPGFSLWFGF